MLDIITINKIMITEVRSTRNLLHRSNSSDSDISLAIKDINNDNSYYHNIEIFNNVTLLSGLDLKLQKCMTIH